MKNANFPDAVPHFIYNLYLMTCGTILQTVSALSIRPVGEWLRRWHILWHSLPQTTSEGQYLSPGTLRTHAKITSHFMPTGGVSKIRNMPDMPVFLRLAISAPRRIKCNFIFA